MESVAASSASLADSWVFGLEDGTAENFVQSSSSFDELNS